MSNKKEEINTLEVKNVYMKYKKKDKHFALNDVNFKIEKGDFHAFIGENGAGKSTTIKIISGLNNDYQGDVFIMMSKNRRLVRMFMYDKVGSMLFEKKFHTGYQFMKVVRTGDEEVYRINWKDVVLLLENPVVKSLKIR